MPTANESLRHFLLLPDHVAMLNRSDGWNVSHLLYRYNGWAIENGMNPLSKRSLVEQMALFSNVIRRKGRGGYVYHIESST